MTKIGIRLDKITTKDGIIYTVFDNYTACVGDIESKSDQTALNECPSNPPSYEILSSVTYNKNEYEVISLYKKAFYNCKLSKLTLPNTIKYIWESAIDLCYIENEIKLPDNLEQIARYALSNARYKTFTVSANLKTIGDGAFAYNPNLETIKIDPNNKLFALDGQGILYDKNYKQLYQVPSAKTEHVIIPPTVTEIRAASFASSKITELIIPVTVKTINAGLASLCTNLKRVYILGNIKAIDVYTYFLNDKLELLSYQGTLPFQKNILETATVDKITVCKGYKGINVAGRSFIIDQQCFSYPLDKTCFYCQESKSCIQIMCYILGLIPF